mgnify:CR=1 FL=1
MSNFRLFIALDPTPETVAVLRRAQVCLRDVHWSGARWLPPEQWHATLRFLGATPEDQVQHWKRTLQQFDVLARDAAPLPIDGVAIWPAPAHPRVIVVTAKYAIWAQDMATRLEARARGRLSRGNSSISPACHARESWRTCGICAMLGRGGQCRPGARWRAPAVRQRLSVCQSVAGGGASL